MFLDDKESVDWWTENMKWAIPAIIAAAGVLVAFLGHMFGVWKYFFPNNPFAKKGNEKKIEAAKLKTNILFIDDDTSFRVVDILKKAGWVNTSIQTDVESLDEGALTAANIVFVDIQGVGKMLDFNDGGLGLTAAIKQKHGDKYVVVYSSETRGNRFHKGLKAADDFLAKNAELYEFQKIVEDFVLNKK